MLKLKQKEGITLIALIITIIVMLILVAVTVTVALNGGLFDKAEEAATLTTIEQEKEALNMAAISAWESGKGVDFVKMETPEGFDKLEDGKYKNKQSGRIYNIDKKTGTAIGDNSNEENNNTEPNEEDMLGLYGKKEYAAIEILGNGKAVLYQSGNAINGEYKDGVSTFTIKKGDEIIETITANYTFDLIKDEQSGEIINKIICYQYEGETLFLSTQETTGLNLDLYRNKYYRSDEGATIFFYDGYFSVSDGSTNIWNYCVYKGYIWVYGKQGYCFERLASINNDGTITIVGDGMGNSYGYTWLGEVFTEVK